MDFYHRDSTTANGIAQCDRRVCESSRIEYDGLSPITNGSMKCINEDTLVVRLQAGKVDAAGLRPLHQGFIYLVESDPSVDLRFALTEEVEVGAVQDQDLQKNLPSVGLTDSKST